MRMTDEDVGVMIAREALAGALRHDEAADACEPLSEEYCYHREAARADRATAALHTGARA